MQHGDYVFMQDSREQVHAGKKLKDVPRADLMAFCNKIEREILDRKNPDEKVVSCFNISREYLRSTEPKVNKPIDKKGK